MNKKTGATLSILIALVAIGVIVSYSKKTREVAIVLDDNVVLFEKYAVWGPCPPSVICHQTTKVYYSGEMVMEGKTQWQSTLEKDTLAKIVEKINTTNIMRKDCAAKMVTDYGATYIMRVGEKEKVIEYPGCERELREIEALLPQDRFSQ